LLITTNLHVPILYLSLYFKTHRSAYYDLLDRVRTKGDWEAWLDFFLTGVRETADQADRSGSGSDRIAANAGPAPCKGAILLVLTKRSTRRSPESPNGCNGGRAKAPVRVAFPGGEERKPFPG
jgi:hypothetical protein